MGIFGALIASVGGLRAQSYALENISGNIANSQTIGFKRTDTNFADLVANANPRAQIAGGVLASSRSTNTVQGDVQNAQVDTYMAINGDGFFVVQKPLGFVDNRPVFSGVDAYTRRGDFEIDRDGYLVNGAGYYLKLLRVDPTTGNVVGSVPDVIQFQNDFLPAQATSEIEYRANLADYPLTGEADRDVPQSELLDATLRTGATGNATITGAQATQFVNTSVSGGAITVYDSLGSPVNVQMRWAKTASADYGGTDTWNMFYLRDGNATGATTAWVNAGIQYTFSANGQMTAPGSTATLTGVSIGGVALGNINLVHGTNGMTQFSDPNGNVQVNQLKQNGYPAGELLGISVTEGGRIAATYSNGRSLDVAEIPLAAFSGDNMLQKLDGAAFAQTVDSGAPVLGAVGDIIGKSLEGSNTDIADEFTKLIVTQQAYAANTRVVSTSDEMLQEALQMIR